MPLIIQGTVITATGSSFPELSSTVLATLIHRQFDPGVGAIVGSAMFNTLVIPTVSALSSRDELTASRLLVYKEALFYMLAVSVLLLTFAFAVIYASVEGRPLIGTVTRPLALVPTGLYGLYVFTQYQDLADRLVKVRYDRLSFNFTQYQDLVDHVPHGNRSPSAGSGCDWRSSSFRSSSRSKGWSALRSAWVPSSGRRVSSMVLRSSRPERACRTCSSAPEPLLRRTAGASRASRTCSGATRSTYWSRYPQECS